MGRAAATHRGLITHNTNTRHLGGEFSAMATGILKTVETWDEMRVQEEGLRSFVSVHTAKLLLLLEW